jgi:hypothetical protein
MIPEGDLKRVYSPEEYEKYSRYCMDQSIRAAQIEGLVSCPRCSYAVIVPDGYSKDCLEYRVNAVEKPGLNQFGSVSSARMEYLNCENALIPNVVNGQNTSNLALFAAKRHIQAYVPSS